MTEAFDQTAKMSLKPMNTVLGADLSLLPLVGKVFDPMHVPVLNIGIRVVSSAEILVTVEEYDGSQWTVRDKMLTIPGETVWHHNLKCPDFRVGVENQSSEEVTFSLGIKWMDRA